jgi:hypothetical protein
MSTNEIALLSFPIAYGVLWLIDTAHDYFQARKLNAKVQQQKAEYLAKVRKIVDGVGSDELHHVSPLFLVMYAQFTINEDDLAKALEVSTAVVAHYKILREPQYGFYANNIDPVALLRNAKELIAIRNDPTGFTAAMYGINL